MNPTVDVLNWARALAKIDEAGAKVLAKKLGELPLSVSKRNALRFYLVTYRYGDTIATNSGFHPESLHSENGSIENIKADLNYASIPLGLALDKVIEVNSVLTFDAITECVPTTLISRGELFGVFETLDIMLGLNRDTGRSITQATWNVSAGAQSAILNFPTGRHKRKWEPDWKAIKSIADKCSPNWECHVLFFPKLLFTDPSFSLTLLPFLFKAGWTQNQIIIHYNEILDNALNDLSIWCQKNCGGEYRDCIFWFFVRLFLVANNIRPGYTLIDDSCDDSRGPFVEVLRWLQSNNHTRNRNTPLLFQPAFLKDSSDGVYCSPYQATIVGRIGTDNRTLDKHVITPINLICEQIAGQCRWLYRMLDMKDGEGKRKTRPFTFHPTVYRRGVTIKDRVGYIKQPDDDRQFAKALIHVINGT